mgnify:FL=1
MTGPGVGVLRMGDLREADLENILSRYGMQLVMLGNGAPIPGSHWGEPEAGLAGDRLFVRPDTPAHSALHEACHYVCMSPRRRAGLFGDAGGDYAEENGVCYLQIVLAGLWPGVGRTRLMADMDAWGYSFRLGSARRWFDSDADDARAWLMGHGILDQLGQPTGSLRGEPAIPEPGLAAR